MEALQEEKKGEHAKSGGPGKKTTTRPKIEETLAALMTKLAEKRRSVSRPDDITVGFHSQVLVNRLRISIGLLY